MLRSPTGAIRQRLAHANRHALDQALLLRAAELGMATVLGLVLIATLAPFQLALPTRLALDLELRVGDVLLNACMLAPLGFLLRLRFRVGAWTALLIGALLSTGFESAQLFVPARCPSPIDVLTNALGCALGQRLHAWSAPASERVLLQLLKQPPTFEDSVWLGVLLLAVAIAPLELGAGHAGFHWTLGLAPLHGDARAIVLGLIASLCIAAWLGYTLAPRASHAASAYVVLVVGAIELCRGFSAEHVASLASLVLAIGCAAVASRVRHAQRVWV